MQSALKLEDRGADPPTHIRLSTLTARFPTNMPWPPTARKVEKLPVQHRRASPRRALSARLSLHLPHGELAGWTLNVSDGGLRAIVEDAVVDTRMDVTLEVREDSCSWRRRASVVWVRREPGGCVIGLAFAERSTIFGAPPANDTSGGDILSDNEPIYSSRFSFG